MTNDYSTIRIWNKTLKGLRQLHADTGDSMVEILQRLVLAELEKTNKSEEEGGACIADGPMVPADLTLVSRLEVQRTFGGREWFRLPNTPLFAPAEQSDAYDTMRNAAARLGGDFQLVQVASTVLAKVTGRANPVRSSRTRKAETDNG